MSTRVCWECGIKYTWESGRFSKTQWLKGENESRCKACVSATGPVGGATGDGLGGFSTIRNNATERYAATAGDTSMTAKVYRDRVFSTGAFKVVYKGLYNGGSRCGEECVFKKFKSNVRYHSDYFDKDVTAAEKAVQLVDKFNSQRFSRLKIRVNVPEILTTGTGRDKTKWLVEPFVYNWVKFNSNSGWYRDVDDVDDVMQAVSHFSYHTSGGQFVVCDLQGGVYRDGVILSDPLIHSRNAERFGGGDLGPVGISTFFSRHRCTDMCGADWIMPRDLNAYVECNESSSLLGNRGIPAPEYLHTLAPLDEDGACSDGYSDDGW
jgi:hypothetical protein